MADKVLNDLAPTYYSPYLHMPLPQLSVLRHAKLLSTLGPLHLQFPVRQSTAQLQCPLTPPITNLNKTLTYTTSFPSPSFVCFIANDFCLKVSGLFSHLFSLAPS